MKKNYSNLVTGNNNLLTQGPKMKLPSGFCPAPSLLGELKDSNSKSSESSKEIKASKILHGAFCILLLFIESRTSILGLSLHAVVGAEDAEKIDCRGEAANS
jgi:hypothetical protein